MYKPLAIIATCITLAACQSAPQGGGQALSKERLSGNWVLSQWNQEPAKNDYGNANIKFSWQESKGKVNGSNGCNLFFGGVEIKGNQLRFGQLANTLRACPLPLMKQEQAFMQLLANPELKTQLNDDTLKFKAGEQSLTFTRAD